MPRIDLKPAIKKRLRELFDLRPPGFSHHPATLADLIDLAMIADDELQKVYDSIALNRKDASQLGEEWGTTEGRD